MGYTRQRLRQMAMERKYDQEIDFWDRLHGLTADQLVWLDEVSADKRNMSRRWGWCKRGRRGSVRGHFVRGQRYSTVALLHQDGMLDYKTVAGSFTG